MGKKSDKQHAELDPQARVRKQVKKGKVKKKCCKSKPRCKKCPVLALQKAKADLETAA